jgi:hypothetical protein
MNSEIRVQSGFNISTFARLYLMIVINYIRKYLKVLLFTYNLLCMCTCTSDTVNNINHQEGLKNQHATYNHICR